MLLQDTYGYEIMKACLVILHLGEPLILSTLPRARSTGRSTLETTLATQILNMGLKAMADRLLPRQVSFL